MNLNFNVGLIEGYKSSSQKARILSEDWVLRNSYCPYCGNNSLSEFENNLPVADFFCNNCKEEYELKSKNGKLPDIVIDGAYETMINRINSEKNPNFFFLTYSKQLRVQNFFIIPKQFFTEEIIIKRPPLKDTARRAGWIGCNINISQIVEIGKVFLVKDSEIVDKETVKNSFRKTLFLRENCIDTKRWLIEILKCIDSLKKQDFTLDEIYLFEDYLRDKFPNNNFVKDKIRQQLQMLRDKGYLEFIQRGKYRLI